MASRKGKNARHEFTPSLVADNAESYAASAAVPQSNYDLRIIQSLRRIIRAVDLHSRKLSMQHNITGPQLACLLILRDHGPLTASSLARKVYLSPSTIVGILDRLEEKSLVVRKRDSGDRRVVNVAITATGRELVDSAPSPLQETMSRALQDLPEIEQVSMVISLEKIVSLMEAEGIDAAPVLETGSLVSSKSTEKNTF